MFLPLSDWSPEPGPPERAAALARTAGLPASVWEVMPATATREDPALGSAEGMQGDTWTVALKLKSVLWRVRSHARDHHWAPYRTKSRMTF